MRTFADLILALRLTGKLHTNRDSVGRINLESFAAPLPSALTLVIAEAIPCGKIQIKKEKSNKKYECGDSIAVTT